MPVLQHYTRLSNDHAQKSPTVHGGLSGSLACVCFWQVHQFIPTTGQKLIKYKEMKDATYTGSGSGV